MWRTRFALPLLAFGMNLFLIPLIQAQNKQPVTIQIVDSEGKPVDGGASYWYRGGKGKKLMPENGRLSVPNCEGLIVVQKDGFQYNGIMLEDLSADETKLILLRDDESGPLATTAALPFSDGLREEILQTFESMCDANLSQHGDDERIVVTTLQLLARINPGKTLDFIENNSLDQPMEMSVRQHLVVAMAKTDFDLAAEVADDVQQPMFRASMFVRLLNALPKNDPRIETVELQWIEAIKAVPQPQLRLAIWASLAEHYKITGRQKQAQKIIDEHLDDVKKLPTGGWSGYPRSLFAALIVNDDFELANQMIEGLDDNERNRALGRLAFHCCRTQPEKAIDLLARMKFGDRAINTARYPVKIAHRMAVEQTEAAFQVAASIQEPNQRAWAYGMIADRLYESKPEQAKQALALASASLNDPGLLRSMSYFTPAATMAGLIPVIEKVQPTRVQGAIWNSVWLAIPRSRWSVDSTDNRIQNTATRIARYDAALATALNGTDPVQSETRVQSAINQLVLDAEHMEDLIKSQFDQQGFTRSVRPSERVIELLQSDRESFWNKVSLPELMQWPGKKFEEH